MHLFNGVYSNFIQMFARSQVAIFRHRKLRKFNLCGKFREMSSQDMLTIFCNLDDIRIGLMQKHYTGYVLVKNTFVNDRK